MNELCLFAERTQRHTVLYERVSHQKHISSLAKQAKTNRRSLHERKKELFYEQTNAFAIIIASQSL